MRNHPPTRHDQPHAVEPAIAAPADGVLRLRDVARRPAAKAVVRAWRELANAPRDPGPPTLVACSGGNDSTALLLALASARSPLVVAHVRHDWRPEADTRADALHVRRLADRLGLPAVVTSVTTPPGNAEGNARRARAHALARIALRTRCPVVALGHHADDQLETLVMALLRGAGTAGLRGCSHRRVLRHRSTGDAVTFIRPMLAVRRDDARRLCDAAGVTCRRDPTNSDTTRLRAALRHGPIADLVTLRPRAAERAARSADIIRDAHLVLSQRAAQTFGPPAERLWPRDRLRSEPRSVIGAGLRRAIRHAGAGVGLDRVPGRAVAQAVDAICDRRTHPRTFMLSRGVRIVVTARSVSMTAPPDDGAQNGPSD